MFESFTQIASVIVAIATTTIGTYLTYILRARLNSKIEAQENKEITDEVDKVTRILSENEANVLTLMVKNVAELREYYVINKQQARNSFSAALSISILGFILLASGILLVYINPKNNEVVPYSTIGGVIVEVIAGLFFWLYSKAIRQINIFHKSLQSTEKFLTAIQLVEKISEDKRDNVYQLIINKIINSNLLPADSAESE